MLYSDFCAPTLSTSADTAATTANITYNGVGGQVYFIWASGGGQTATAAQGIKPYVLLTGTGMPGVTANIPMGRWRSAYLAGASVGSVGAGPTAFPLNAVAPANGTVTVDVRNAALVPLAQATQQALDKPVIGGSLEREWVSGNKKHPIVNHGHLTFQVRGWELILGSLAAWVWLGGLDGLLGLGLAPLEKLKDIYAPVNVPGQTPPAGLYYTPGGRVINPTSTQSPPAPGGGVYPLPTQGSPFPRGPFAGGAFGWL